METPYSNFLRFNIYRAFKEVVIEPPSEIMEFITANVVALENLMEWPILERGSDFNVYVEPFFHGVRGFAGYYSHNDEIFINEKLYAYTDNPDPFTFTRDNTIVHELAHFYWNSGKHASTSWITEGVPEWISWRLSPWPPEAYSHFLEWRPSCQVVRLEDLPTWCEYDQGRRLFDDLHKNLGEEEFLAGLRRLYAILVEDRHEGWQVSYEKAIAYMKQAFPESVHHRIDRY